MGWFIAGFVLGEIAGIIIPALLVANKMNNNIEEDEE